MLGRVNIEHGMMVRRRPSTVPNAVTMVWLHGLGESSQSFDPVASHPALGNFHHVLPDLPGYGRSPWPSTPQSLEEVADVIAAWLDQPAILVGHSQGGVLATLVAERVPLRARAVVNVDGNLSRGDCTFSAMAAAYPLADFVATGAATMRDAVYLRGVDERPLRGYHAAMVLADPATFHRHATELVALSEREDLAPRLAALPCAHLFVAGVPDGICAYSRGLLDRHRVTWVRLEPAGHWVYLDQLDKFVAHLAGFAASAQNA